MSPELETAVIAYSLYKLIPVATTSVKSLRGAALRNRQQAAETSAGADVELTPSASAVATLEANGHKPGAPRTKTITQIVTTDAAGRFAKPDGTNKRTPAPVG